MGDAFNEGRRASGVLLHPTSLPGPYVGDLGPNAYRFIEWLAEAGQRYWQLLPLVPVDSGGSPYNGLSALAGNPLLVSPELLERDGLLQLSREHDFKGSLTGRVDFAEASSRKGELLREAHRAFRSGRAEQLLQPFDEFVAENTWWLADYVLFRALRDQFGQICWTQWPEEIKERRPEAIQQVRQQLSEEIDRYAFQQFVFDRQWRSLHNFAREHAVRIIGDLPIFVAHDSSDVWVQRELFQLDAEGNPEVVAGVPPDYFSATGQRWGNPLYRWDVLASRGYDWWIDRFRRTLEMVDIVRIDHFRGFESYWQIDVGEETAVNGKWVQGPGETFFRRVAEELGPLPVIAEDLGLITSRVEELRDDLGFPGMRVLQFAFDGDSKNPHLPANHPPNSIAYTGTHDNDTVVGWWAGLGAEERERVVVGLNEHNPSNWTFIDAVFASPALTAIVPLQDVLGLGNEARMNTPGEPEANWTWRLDGLPTSEAAARLRETTLTAGRAPAGTARRAQHLDPENT